MSRRLFCYELNEVPWRVVDRYLEHRPDGPLARLLDRSVQFTTTTVDSGELHPWTTWPTVHRGVANDVHGIRFLNQDLTDAAEWPPIWELLNAAGVTTGLCGSLQSYPPVGDEHMQFHVPDTFAAGSETKPERYAPFQGLNLRLTGNNTAVSGRVTSRDAADAIGLLNVGIRPGTMYSVARQLVREKVNPLHTRRRSLLQPELAIDVLFDCMKHHQPQFVTFFSNHVAGIMHRYWKYSFPEDFDYALHGDTDRFHAQSLVVAMEQFEHHLERLEPLCNRYDYELLVCSSMGQEAVKRGDYTPEVRLQSLERLLAALSRSYDVTIHPAMHPDIAFELASADDVEAFRAELVTVRDSAGKALFEYKYAPAGRTLNLRLAVSESLARDRQVHLGGHVIPLEEAGFETFERDVGTGYHQPEGIMIWKQGQGPASQTRETIDSRRIAPTVLEYFGLPAPDYMMDPLETNGARSAGDAEQRPVRATG